MELTTGLLGHWPLQGDLKDRSGCGHDGCGHGAGVADGLFDGRATWIEVPASPRFDLGVNDFALAAWVYTRPGVTGVIGDVLCRFDPACRNGFTLSIKPSSGGYSSLGDDRHAVFGTDDGRVSAWEDCGRPSATSNYVSNSLTVYDGHLYAGITDAEREEDWCHVYRYRGGQAWEDCGRLGDRKTHGAGPMVVHDGQLHAATWTYDWTRVGLNEPLDDFCCVYRHRGGTEWEDLGQPGECRRLFGLASYRGSLYVSAEDGCCYVHRGDRDWEVSGRFPNYAHPLGVHDGRLYAGVLNPAGVWAFDGSSWEPRGNPQGSEGICNQIHALEVFRGQLHATTWPLGHVVRLDEEEGWTDLGRLGDALEINGLTVYNGKLYGGTIPRAEVFRYDDGAGWTSVGRFLDPAGYEFCNSDEWARVTSLTVYDGRLFASMGSCTSSRRDAPCDFRGRVYAMRAGEVVSHDTDLGPEWHHLVAQRRSGRLELYVDGELARESAPAGDPCHLAGGGALLIGAGETGRFDGRMRDVRVYARAMAAHEIPQLARTPPQL